MNEFELGRYTTKPIPKGAERVGYNTQEEIIKSLQQLEERLILEVLENYLGRKPSIEDATKTRRIIEENGHSSVYDLAYGDFIIGKVVYEWPGLLHMEVKTKIRFEPYECPIQVKRKYPNY